MGIKYQKNILTSFQERVLIEFFKTYEEIQHFYLTGGTALAGFYLHHRYSDDLDFFTHGEYDSFKLEQVLKDFVQKNAWEFVSSRKETLFYEAFIREHPEAIPLKIDFVKDTSPHFGAIQHWGKIRIDSLRNIASNKIAAIFGRTEPKDFVDLFFLIKEGIAIDAIFKEAEAKDGGLNEFFFSAQLRNVDRFTRLPRMILPLTLNELKTDLLKLADEFLDKAKPISS